MKIGVPKEIVQNERRVALTPDAVGKLVRDGIDVIIESQAGSGSFFRDQAYTESGAKVVSQAADIYREASVVLKVHPPTTDEVELMSSGTTLLSLLQPSTNLEIVSKLVEKSITSFAMDNIPRIARAQRMDVLSSMSSLAGYKAVLMAADSLGKYLPMMMTAAGTTAPAQGLILGAGVAGLQAIATSRRLGAVVEAFDVRPAVKEQVESLGAKFIEVENTNEAEDAGGYARELSKDSQDLQRDLIHQHVKKADFVITTALIPGRPAPLLITEAMVQDMRPGSAIVDLAAEAGGNCEVTEPGSTIVVNDVTIHGPLNLASEMSIHASQMYSKNVTNLLEHLSKDGAITLDFDDDITNSCCVTHNGEITHEQTLNLMKEKS